MKSPSEKRNKKILAHVPEGVKKAVQDEVFRRSRPGAPFSESDLIFEILRERYKKKSQQTLTSQSKRDSSRIV